MEKLIELFNSFNAPTLFGIGVMLWYFTREIRKEIRDDIAAQTARTDKLYEMFIDLLKERK